MTETVRSVPRPLVRLNQWVIFLSVIAAWVTGIEWILALPLIAGIMGLVFKFNPIMQAGKLLLKKKPSNYVPEEFAQQQFNQMIAVVCLAGGLISYLLDWKIVGYVFTGMVAIASFVAILGFCIGCFIRFQWQQYMYKKSANKLV